MTMVRHDSWLQVKEAAERARVSCWSVYQAIERGELRHVRLGGRRAIRTKPEWVDEWLHRYERPIEGEVVALTQMNGRTT